MFEFLKFEFQNFQTTSHGETTKIKVVDPKNLYNFLVDQFSFEIILSRKTTFEFSKI
jgi:hypothetical protein